MLHPEQPGKGVNPFVDQCRMIVRDVIGSRSCAFNRNAVASAASATWISEPMSLMTHPIADVFLLGFIAATWLVAALFFLSIGETPEVRFSLAFAAFFGIQGIVHSAVLLLSHPNEGNAWVVPNALAFSSVSTRSDPWKNSVKP